MAKLMSRGTTKILELFNLESVIIQ